MSSSRRRERERGVLAERRAHRVFFCSDIRLFHLSLVLENSSGVKELVVVHDVDDSTPTVHALTCWLLSNHTPVHISPFKSSLHPSSNSHRRWRKPKQKTTSPPC